MMSLLSQPSVLFQNRLFTSRRMPTPRGPPSQTRFHGPTVLRSSELWSKLKFDFRITRGFSSLRSLRTQPSSRYTSDRNSFTARSKSVPRSFNQLICTALQLSRSSDFTTSPTSSNNPFLSPIVDGGSCIFFFTRFCSSGLRPETV